MIGSRALLTAIASGLLGAFLLFGNAAAQVPGGGVAVKPPFVTGDCVKSAGPGAISTTGSACGGGSGSGTVNAGTLGQTGYYASAGTAISGSSSIIMTATGLNIHPFSLGSMDDVVVGSFTPQAGNFTTIGATSVGSGIFTTLTAQTSLTLGASSALTGTSGNGTILGTTSGVMTSGDCVSINASGNLVAAGGPCTTGGGGGTVTSSTAGQMTWYASTGTTVIGNANVTASSGALRLGQATSVAGSLLLSGGTSGTGTVRVSAAAGATTFWLPDTNGTAGVPYLSGAGSGPITFGTLSGNTSAFVTAGGAIANAECLQGDGSGNIVSTGFACASSTGTVNAGTTGQATYYASNGTAVSGTSSLILSGTSFAANPSSIGALDNIAIGFTTPRLGNFVSIGATTAGTGLFTTIGASGQITSTVTTGTAPLVIASTTNVANLNASSLGGATFAAPGSIGSGTPGSGAFTTLSASSTISGTGFSTYLASPPAIGGSAPAAGTFTTLTANTSFTLNGSTAKTSTSGTGLILATTTGAQTSGNCVQIDASGNHVATGSACATGGNTGGLAWGGVKTANFNATSGTAYAIDTITAGAFTMTLPASPSDGDAIRFEDARSGLATNSLTVARNGNNIMNLAEDMTVATVNAASTLQWSSTLSTWIMY